MSHMSYCLFRNTLPDLRDCDARLTEIDSNPLSPEEHRAMLKFVALCARIGTDYADTLVAEAELAAAKKPSAERTETPS